MDLGGMRLKDIIRRVMKGEEGEEIQERVLGLKEKVMEAKVGIEVGPTCLVCK